MAIHFKKLLFLPVLLALFTGFGCVGSDIITQSGAFPADNSSVQTGSENTSAVVSSAPMAPYYADYSFINGAPRLNEAAELRFLIKPDCKMNNVSIRINLPDGFELISGDLEWSGDIIGVMELAPVVRAVKYGDYEIETLFSYPDQREMGISGRANKVYIYALVDKDSSKWGREPSWRPMPKSTPILSIPSSGDIRFSTPEEEKIFLENVKKTGPKTATSVILQDGSIRSSDGSILYPDGTLVLPDGTVKHINIPK
ncbi:MAG: hypothetical protein PHO26_00110 [Dehalococcoidia bacterium]|nr:hypothetical protein [Dehalococcoidia bacterium]MDD5493827.1 hypothetical protein [Dehalococcoidia bacterium]